MTFDAPSSAIAAHEIQRSIFGVGNRTPISSHAKNNSPLRYNRSCAFCSLFVPMGMAKSTASYVCQSCGASSGKWAGKCEACNGWNTIVAEGAAPPIGGAARRIKGRRFALEDLKTDEPSPLRRPTGIAEFDRVTGGGLVPGSALLVGGDPGIGKSTLILQALGKYAQSGQRAVYISGEEAMAQVRMRAARMGLSNAPLALGAATN